MILIVEDCAPIAAILMGHLASAGYRCILASDGREAIEHLARGLPECILLDLMLPGMNGTEVLHHLRRTPATASIPVVLVSAQVGPGHTHLRSQVDGDSSIGKPFTRDQVLKAVRAAVEKRLEKRAP